jgi:hypothetical protein
MSLDGAMDARSGLPSPSTVALEGAGDPLSSPSGSADGLREEEVAGLLDELVDGMSPDGAMDARSEFPSPSNVVLEGAGDPLPVPLGSADGIREAEVAGLLDGIVDGMSLNGAMDAWSGWPSPSTVALEGAGDPSPVPLGIADGIREEDVAGLLDGLVDGMSLNGTMDSRSGLPSPSTVALEGAGDPLPESPGSVDGIREEEVAGLVDGIVDGMPSGGDLPSSSTGAGEGADGNSEEDVAGLIDGFFDGMSTDGAMDSRTDFPSPSTVALEGARVLLREALGSADGNVDGVTCEFLEGLVD